jgi:hypothetical protein
MALIPPGSRGFSEELLLLGPLHAVFVGGVAVDRMQVVQGIAAEVLAGVFDDHSGAIEVIRGIASGFVGPVPSEVRLVELDFDLLQASLGRSLGQIVDPETDELHENGALCVGEGAAIQSVPFGLDAILAGARLHPSSFVSLDGTGPLLLVQAGDELKGKGGFVFHGDDLFLPEMELVGLGANERGGHGHLLSVEGDVEGDVVSIPLHAPAAGFGWGAKNGDPKIGRAKSTPALGLLFGLEEEVIGQHDVAGFEVSLLAEDGGEEGAGAFELRLGEVSEAESAGLGLRGDVGPFLALGVMEREEGLLTLVRSEGFEKGVGRGHHGLGRMVGGGRFCSGEDFTGESPSLVGFAREGRAGEREGAKSGEKSLHREGEHSASDGGGKKLCVAEIMANMESEPEAIAGDSQRQFATRFSGAGRILNCRG